ncbi:hypothetical protein DJ013_10130 [Arcticibacterium luteifluviistationis]|uniref:Uncharacterized protein n=2 Tax=Arcticibacterium luteifluviistationis TaxID=1784714 RepID=A0A2Z4GB46_9BACT|nr:hypothetical protein DJ013_10130 [Arcticibacterium luteifluviistationis]
MLKYYKNRGILWMFLNKNKQEMTSSRPAYLIDRLLKNNISKEELEELLANIGDTEMSEDYAVILKEYFDQLLAENITKKFINNDLPE